MSTAPASNDPLYPVFERYLHSGLYDAQPIEMFVRDVVETYFQELNRAGQVPQRMHETLRQDLAQDVLDMLRIKIYGFSNIAGYNRQRR